MQNKGLIAAAVIGAIVIVGLIGFLIFGKKPTTTNSVISITMADVQAKDGKSGHECYVVYKGTVYRINPNPYWQNGEHTESEGQVFCGNDVTPFLSQSPHGESVFQTSAVTKMGQLAQ
jgi:predicted heme/steroid binding protein